MTWINESNLASETSLLDGFYGLQLWSMEWLTKAQFSQVCLMGNCCTGGWWPRVCRAILRVCSFHRYGMRFLRGRVEVVDSLATTSTTRMVISRHVQSGNFTPSLFNKCVVINSLAHVHTLSSQIIVSRRLIFLAFCSWTRTFSQVTRLIFSRVCRQARLFESGIVSNCAHNNSVVFRGIVMKISHSIV